MKKTSRIGERCRNVFMVIVSWELRAAPTTFNEIVSKTGFSRGETAYHLALLKKRGKITGGEKGYVREQTAEEREHSLNEFMFGYSNPVHVFGVGYVDPSSRCGKRFLDP